MMNAAKSPQPAQENIVRLADYTENAGVEAVGLACENLAPDLNALLKRLLGLQQAISALESDASVPDADLILLRLASSRIAASVLDLSDALVRAAGIVPPSR